MSERSIDLFFYGLFMDAKYLTSRGLSPSQPRLATVQDYDLVIGRRATLIPKPGEQVHGLIIALPWRQVGPLYQEESVSDYRPEAVLAWLENQQPVAALCYNLPLADDTPPNQAYAAQLYDLIERLNFPQDYLEKVRKFRGD